MLYISLITAKPEPGPDQIPTYAKGIDNFISAQKHFSQLYLTHGNNMAHCLKYIENQANYRRDKKLGKLGSSYMNWSISRGLYFCQVVCANPFGDLEKKNIPISALQLPTLELYSTEKILPLIDAGYAKNIYHSETYEKHKYDSKEPFEIEIFNKNLHKPDPDIILVGRFYGCQIKLNPNWRDLLKNYLYLLNEMYPKKTIIYFPKLLLTLNKDKEETAHLKYSRTAYKIADLLVNKPDKIIKLSQISDSEL